MGDATGIENLAGLRFIMDTLIADPVLTAALSTTSSIFELPAPEETVYPIVGISCLSPGVVVQGVGNVEIMHNQLWLVRGIVEGTDSEPLVPIGRRIHALLEGSQTQALPDGTLEACYRTQAFRLAQISGGRQFRSLGGIYRLFVQA